MLAEHVSSVPEKSRLNQELKKQEHLTSQLRQVLGHLFGINGRSAEVTKDGPWPRMKGF